MDNFQYFLSIQTTIETSNEYLNVMLCNSNFSNSHNEKYRYGFKNF